MRTMARRVESKALPFGLGDAGSRWSTLAAKRGIHQYVLRPQNQQIAATAHVRNPNFTVESWRSRTVTAIYLERSTRSVNVAYRGLSTIASEERANARSDREGRHLTPPRSYDVGHSLPRYHVRTGIIAASLPSISSTLLIKLSTQQTLSAQGIRYYSSTPLRRSLTPPQDTRKPLTPQPSPSQPPTSPQQSSPLDLNPTTIPQPLISPTKESREYIWTVPNILTFSRLAITPVIGYTILTSQPFLALSLFFYAGLTDLIDGHIARAYNQRTVVGSVIDPMADKFLMTTVVICTTIQGLLPLWLAVIILGRDVGLAISAIYFRYISLPPPKTFARYWDFGLPSAEVRPTEISKINTLLQLLLVGAAMVLPVIPGPVVEAWNLMGVFEGWGYLVAATTVWSGASYVFSKDAVKILRR